MNRVNNTIQNQRKPDTEGMMSDIYKMRQDKLIKTPRTMFVSMEKKFSDKPRKTKK
jgi:hypothetical protein